MSISGYPPHSWWIAPKQEGKAPLRLQQIWKLLKSTALEWQANKAQRLSAALAYYTMFSLAPLLVLLVALASELWGEKVAESEVIAEIETLLGRQSADALRQLIPACGLHPQAT
jgi:membrane protein